MKAAHVSRLINLICWIFLSIARPAAAQLSNEDLDALTQTAQVRVFIEIDGGNKVKKILASGKDSSGLVRLVEVGMDRSVATDTLNVWVQHFQEGMRIDQRSAFADLIIACYPELMSSDNRNRHVLPGGNGPIYVYSIHHAKMVIVSNERMPILELVLQPPYVAN